MFKLYRGSNIHIYPILLYQKVVEFKLTKTYCNVNWLITILQVQEKIYFTLYC